MKNNFSFDSEVSSYPDTSLSEQGLINFIQELSIDESSAFDPQIKSNFLDLFVKVYLSVLSSIGHTNLLSKVPSVKQSVIENQSFNSIAATLSRIYIFTPKNILSLYPDLLKLITSFISHECTTLIKKFKHYNHSNLFDDNFLLDLKYLKIQIQTSFSSEQESEIIHLITSKIPRSDVVDILDDSLQVRRLDSLARLMSLNTNISVCAAVAFYNREVIIGGNNSDTNISGIDISAILIQRFLFIRSFIQSIHKDYFPHFHHLFNSTTLTYQDTYQSLLNDFVKKLNTLHHGSSFPSEVLFQAVTKLIYSTILPLHHDSSLSSNDRYCLLESIEISALTVTRRTSIPEVSSYSSNKHFPKLLLIKSQLLSDFSINVSCFPMLVKDAGLVRKFHAEQLIAVYLFELNPNRLLFSSKQPIGVSKLCCPTCHTALLSCKSFQYRGTHHSVKRGVMNILELMISDKLFDKSLPIVNLFVSASSKRTLGEKSISSSDSNISFSQNNCVEDIEFFDIREESSLSENCSISMLNSHSLFDCSLSPIKTSKKSRLDKSESSASQTDLSNLNFQSPVKRKKVAMTNAKQSPFISPGLFKALHEYKDNTKLTSDESHVYNALLVDMGI